MTRDLALGSVMLAIAAVYYRLAAAIPEGVLADEIGPGGLPQVYAALLALLAIGLVAGAVSRRARPLAAADWAAHRRAAGMLLLGAGYLVLAPWLGYLPSLALLMVSTAIYQGGAPGGRLVLVSMAGAAAFWVLFVRVLGIPYPAGFWPAFF